MEYTVLGKLCTEMKLINIIQWIFLLALSVLSMFSVKEVLTQFFSNDTSMKQNEIHIIEIPTITICFEGIKNYEYGIDLNVSIDSTLLALTDKDDYIENVVETELQENLGIIMLEKSFSWVDNELCYKIIRPNDQKEEYIPTEFTVYVKFNESIHFEELPDIEVFFTSEDNSDGIMFKEWVDGVELRQHFEKVIFQLM